jgi:DNA mismatch repair protein MutL
MDNDDAPLIMSSQEETNSQPRPSSQPLLQSSQTTSSQKSSSQSATINKKSRLSKLPDEVSTKIRSDFTINSLEMCVKELLENSLDARATSVDIKLEKSGYDSITVQDNGVGIPHDELQNVCKRFYTSKYKVIEEDGEFSSSEQNDDDYCYLGFRGEALHSLCTNCEELTVITKVQTDDLATKIVLDSHGNIINESKLSGNRGTTVIVKNIFSRGIPVKRTNLRDHLAAELKKMINRIHEYCLSPAYAGVLIRVTDKTNNKLLFTKQKHNNLNESITNVFNRNVSQQMTCLKSEELPESNILVKQVPFSVSLYVPKASCTATPPGMSNKTLVYIFVNGRPIDSHDISNTLKTHWKGTGLKLFLAICCIDYESLNALKENVDMMQSPDKRKCIFSYQIQIQKIIRDLLELLKPPKPVPAVTLQKQGEISPPPATPIRTIGTPSSLNLSTLSTPRPTDISMNAMDVTPRKTPPTTSPSDRSGVVVIRAVSSEKQFKSTTDNLPLVPDANGNLTPMKPLQFTRHYTKSSTSVMRNPFEDDLDDDPPARPLPPRPIEKQPIIEPVKAATQDLNFFNSNKFVAKPIPSRLQTNNSKKQSKSDSDSEDEDGPSQHNRSIYEFFGTDSQKKSLSSTHKQQQKKRKKPEASPKVLDLSEAARKKPRLSSDQMEDDDDDIAFVANVTSDIICQRLVDIKSRSQAPFSTVFFKAYEDESWTMNMDELEAINIIGVPHSETPSELSKACVIATIPAPSDSNTQETQRSAACGLLLFSLFEADKYIQMVTSKTSMSYETNIRPLDNPINLMKIPKFRENKRVLAALTCPYFEKVLKQNGFNIVKQTKPTASQKKVLMSLELNGVLRHPGVESIQVNNISGPYGEDDLYDFACTLANFKDKSLSKVVEQLLSYRQHPDFNSEHPIAKKNQDQLREYVSKKALYLLRPLRLARYIETQAIELAEARCKKCLRYNPDIGQQYDEESLLKYGSELLDKLPESLPLCSPLVTLLSTTASDIRVPFDDKSIREKISKNLSTIFVPICFF